MLWLCIRLPRLPLEAAGAGPARVRQPRSERIALERLAVWAQQWSSHVGCAPPTEAGDDARLWLEIGASLPLFGGHVRLCEGIRAALAQLGYRGLLAIATTPRAASLLTRSAQTEPALDAAALRQQLAALPLALLDLPPATLATLHASGLRRIGQLAAIETAALACRFGPEASRYLQQLYGQMADPVTAVPLPLQYRAPCEFDDDVDSAQALLFPLQRLLWEFQGYLRARDRAVQRLQLRLVHRGHADTQLAVGLAQPGRDAPVLLRLVRERFEALQLPAPVRALHLEADDFVAPAILQTDFFARDAERAQELQQVLDRLRIRLGADSVHGLQTLADYRPERAGRAQPAAAAAGNAAPRPPSMPQPPAAPPCTADAVRPCWLLREPLGIATPGELLAGPERIESGWWDGADVARDYYITRSRAGARQWIYQDLRSGQWFLQGLWS